MLNSIVIAVLLGLVLLLWVTIIVVRGAGHQFPTAYTLLKESPEISRREWIAVRGLIGLIVVVVLLLSTSIF